MVRALGEHGAAIVALPWLAVALFAFLAVLTYGAERGEPLCQRCLAGLQALGLLRKLALLLALTSATIHLALIPAHSGDPSTAILFMLDGLALMAVSAWALLRSGWRPALGLLLFANLAAYAYYLAAGLETADAVGLGTKAIEAAALLGLMIPERWSLVALSGTRREVNS
ncbi:MAG: hypothetical protein JF888_02820 [Candidatus Dormibacteraeota bacterium]|uniref:Uncharacterized protein n=1 Tax=Candidatus Dormiibacter inghamiae TaxID=3127013 RepID=A0A934NCI6_9BACT|nr:hypothetical protein [Candidatus Dormibacteraeota bacterium]MBJ7605511.1 hypothetical protein [Candidatus Dormibacteraeota bacterium]